MNNDIRNLFAVAGLIAAYAALRWAVEEMQNADVSLKNSPLMRFAVARRDAMLSEEFTEETEETVDGSD